MAEQLKILKNSNALNKYAVDADELNYNFKLLEDKIGDSSIKEAIETSGQTYNPLITAQLSKAVAQYVLSYYFFDETGTIENKYVLFPMGNFVLPNSYFKYMEVTFPIKRSNTGACTIQIGSLGEYPLYIDGVQVSGGYLQTGKSIKVRFMGDYWEPVVSDASGSSTTTTGGDLDSAIQTQVRYAITSAGLSYDGFNQTQLAKAIAKYVTTNCYNSTLAGTVYKLTPVGSMAAPNEYTENMMISFVVSATNDFDSTAISIGSLEVAGLYDYYGSELAPNTLKQNAVVTCICRKRNDEFCFYLVSGHLDTLSLSSGVLVDSISDDSTLSTASPTSLVTERAVKSYVDSSVKSSAYNVISSFYSDAAHNNIALHKIGDHGLQLVASDNSTTYYDKRTTNSEDIIASVSTNKVHAIAYVSGFSWESSASPLSDYFGFAKMSGKLDVLRIKHIDSDHTPVSICIEVSVDNSTWVKLVDADGIDSNVYGNFVDLTTDNNDYYTIKLPAYTKSGDIYGTYEDFVASANTYYIRVVPTEMKQDGENTFKWIISDIYFANYVENVPPYTITYPDGSVEINTNAAYFTQYVESDDEQKLILDDVAGGTYTVVKELRSNNLSIISDADIIYNSTMPEATEDNVGKIWVNVGVYPYTTYVCYSTEEEESDDDTLITYEWVQTSLAFIGAVTYEANKITNVINYRGGNTYVAESTMSYFTDNDTLSLNHNFGSSVSVECYLVCTSETAGYVVGEELLLTSNTSIVPVSDTETVLSYIVIASTNKTTKITIKNLYIVNRTAGSLVEVDGTKWKIKVYINKD